MYWRPMMVNTIWKHEDRVLFSPLLCQRRRSHCQGYCQWNYPPAHQPATPSFLNAGRTRRGELFPASSSGQQMTWTQSAAPSTLPCNSRIGGGVGISNCGKLDTWMAVMKDKIWGCAETELLRTALPNQRWANVRSWYCLPNVFTQISSLPFYQERKWRKVRQVPLTGVVIPDKFYELARKNEEMYLFSPVCWTRVVCHLPIPDITEKYDELVANPNITKTKIKARDLKQKFKLQQESKLPLCRKHWYSQPFKSNRR